MADEGGEEDWDPEKEKEPENLQREYLKMGKEMLEEIRAEKEKKRLLEERRKEATAKASEQLSSLRGRLAREGSGSPPDCGIAFTVPTWVETVQRIERCWIQTKLTVGDAPPGIQTAVFQMLMHTQPESHTLPEAKGGTLPTEGEGPAPVQ